LNENLAKSKETRPVRYGEYILLDRVNIGGMAEVFRAKKAGLDDVQRVRAIKRILPNLARDPDFATMFEDEARIAVQLSHANIAQVYELGSVDDSLYIAMEYVEGYDLRTLINSMRKLGTFFDTALVAFVISKVCEALDYAHRKRDRETGIELGIVHRDVSPQNVIVSNEGEVKLIDFGIAKAAMKRTHTEAGILKGKFGYMAPEQVMGGALDGRADIFCVGILMYEMLTTERLFVGDTELATLHKIRLAEVPPPSLNNPHIPPQLEAIVFKALERDVNERYQHASDLQEDLEFFMHQSGQRPYSTRRLRDFMRTTFAEDIELDRSKLEKVLRQAAEQLSESGGSIRQWNAPDLQHQKTAQEDSGSHQLPPPLSADGRGRDHTPSSPRSVRQEAFERQPTPQDRPAPVQHHTPTPRQNAPAPVHGNYPPQREMHQTPHNPPQLSPQASATVSQLPGAIPHQAMTTQQQAPQAHYHQGQPVQPIQPVQPVQHQAHPSSTIPTQPSIQQQQHFHPNQPPFPNARANTPPPPARGANISAERKPFDPPPTMITDLTSQKRRNRRKKKKKNNKSLWMIFWIVLIALWVVLMYFLILVPTPEASLQPKSQTTLAQECITTPNKSKNNCPNCSTTPTTRFT